jgi:hypothetical protein
VRERKGDQEMKPWEGFQKDPYNKLTLSEVFAELTDNPLPDIVFL